jgi:hypothetical protein
MDSVVAHELESRRPGLAMSSNSAQSSIFNSVAPLNGEGQCICIETLHPGFERGQKRGGWRTLSSDILIFGFDCDI